MAQRRRELLSRASARPTPAPRAFDARPDRLDLRDLPYRPPLRSLPERFPADDVLARLLPGYVDAGLILDQGREGACTGFGLACVANYLLWARHLERGGREFRSVSPRMFYEMAKRYDEWPGRDYEGSSCRGALKGWHKHGVCADALWPYALDGDGKPVFVRPSGGWDADAATRPLGVYYRIDKSSITDLQAAIVEIGAAYVSCGVHDGWDQLVRARPTAAPAAHTALPVVPAPRDPKKAGGHAFAIVGYDDRGFIVQNSWGRSWGAGGFAVLPYDDWLERGTDAWACALGVPRRAVRAGSLSGAVVSSRWRMAGGTSLVEADEPPVEQAFEFDGYRPWSTAQAYEHSLVSGNDGELVVMDVTRPREDASGYAKDLVHDRPRNAFMAAPGERARIVIYAHGGLVDEDASIRRVRVLGPCFEANGIYPIFLTWKTGPGETVCDMVEDWGRRVFRGDRPTGFGDLVDSGSDRAIEVLAHGLGRGVWREMCENAGRGARAGHQLDHLARNLAALSGAMSDEGRPLELHFAGHSAGSILLGHLLTRMGEADLAGASPKVKSITLLAPACTSRFALAHYARAAVAGRVDLRRLFIHVLSDANEKRDALPAPGQRIYGKSLLYLVSRALEDTRKMPLLGLERAHDPRFARDTDQWAEEELDAVSGWQDAWPRDNLRVVSTPDVRVGRDGARVQATHGALDNDMETLTATIERIAGRRLVAPLEWLENA